MLVSHENGVQTVDIFADFGQPFSDFPSAQTCVDQYARFLGRYKRRVACAAAR
jgi:hypothetical protein